MRLFFLIVAVHLGLVAVIAAGVGAWGWRVYRAPGPLATAKLVDIPRGYGVSLIAETLTREGAIDDPLLFRLAAKLTDRDSALKAGEYEIPAHVSVERLLSLLENGAVYERKLTVPEGLTSWQIVNLLTAMTTLSGGVTDIPAEGTLLPETYRYRKGESRAAVLDRMERSMANLRVPLMSSDRAIPAPLKSWQDIVTLASIVEKEAGDAKEYARIAGVFINRLRAGMPLQADPTVIYALTGGKVQEGGQGPLGRRLLRDDLAVDSPYNTYKYSGLPPGPIANPGRLALEAVLEPERHDYLYFVANGTGGHVFSKTLEEHNRNVAAWRKLRKMRE
ncbi:MAG: endolytic transglycosylase MltG [Alphaproteobacteria bacterium]|nr:endolytic transglycosylase MltG [Alphaproteobacteria bacterium]